MVYDMFQTVTMFLLKVNTQTSLHFKGWGKMSPCRHFAPGMGLNALFFVFLIKN